MKRLKYAIYGLAMVLGIFLAAQPAAQAGAGIENYWPITPAAKGDRSNGQLTIYYEVIGDGSGACLQGDHLVKMIFLLKLYEKSAKTWRVITQVDEGPYCLEGSLSAVENSQQEALMNFLENSVLKKLTAADYSEIYLKDVVDDYENFISPPLGPPYCVSAEITIVAQ